VSRSLAVRQWASTIANKAHGFYAALARPDNPKSAGNSSFYAIRARARCRVTDTTVRVGSARKGSLV